MNPAKLTFAQLRAEVFRQYHRGAWQAALTFIEHESTPFDKPAEAATVIYWRACFLALLGRAGDALGALEVGLQQGYWWGVQSLLHDPDLRALQDNKAYQAVIAECERRCQQAAIGIQTSRLVVEPSAASGQPYPLVLALHGYGGNAAETLPDWSPLTEHGWLVAALQSSQLAGMDGYHWVDEDQSRRDVQQHLQELSATYSLDPKRLVVGGFSNGGRTALLLALTGAIQARQVIVISVGGSLRDETFAALDWNVLGKANQPHLLLIAGDQDTQVLPRLTQQVEGFKAGGLHVDLQIVPNLGHLMPPDFAARLTRALAGLK